MLGKGLLDIFYKLHFNNNLKIHLNNNLSNPLKYFKNLNNKKILK